VSRHITRAKTAQVLLGCLHLLLCACEGPPARPKPWRHERDPASADAAIASAPAPDGATGQDRAGVLRIRLAAEPRGLNLLVDPDREAVQVAEDTIHETLVRHGPDGIAPLLAESFRVVGGTEIRFVLRKDVRFHDGRPFTAADARASIDAARRPTSRAPRLRAALADVAGAEVWSPRDLRVVLRRQNGYVLRALAEVPMLPAADVAAATPPGTGPYRLASWEATERIVLERDPGYWGAPPAIERVEFDIVPDGAEALVMARRGDLDILPSLIPEHWPQQALAPGMAEAFAPLELAPPRFLAVALNARRPPFDDVRARRAAVLLVDRARLAREGWRGLARPVAGPVWPGGLGDAPGLPPPPHDPQRAMELLDEAGWRAGKDGLRAREGVRLHVVVVGVGEPSDPEREVIVSGLRRGGFSVEVRLASAEAFVDRLRGGDLDAAILDYRGRVDEDLAPFFSTGGARNFFGLSSRPVDATCAALRQVWEPATRRPLVTQLAALLAAEAPFVPLLAPAPQGLVARRVRGVAVHDGWFRIRDLELSVDGPALARP
jgi:peptide/nickel transport system substrate-binding protein